jgi:hypothetical protein
MIHPVDTILSLALLSILFSFGSSRLPGLIKVMAFQGVVVASCLFSSAMRCPPAAWPLPS